MASFATVSRRCYNACFSQKKKCVFIQHSQVHHSILRHSSLLSSRAIEERRGSLNFLLISTSKFHGITNSKSSIDFKKQVESSYGSKIDDGLWQRAIAEGLGKNIYNKKNVEDMVGFIRFAEAAAKAEAAEAKAEAAEAAVAEAAAEIERLKAELLKIEGKKRRQTYPICVSSMAMKSSARAEFRRQQVADDPCPGGFVCHRMFIEFVKASHLMNNGTSESLMEVEKLENDMKDVEQELENYLGNLLSERRTKQSLFSAEYLDEEAPQSAVAAEMFRFALERLKQKHQSRKKESGKQPSIIVSHQFSVVSAVEEADIVRMQAEIDSRFNPLDRSSESQEVALEADTTRRTKTTMHIDILFWFVRPEEDVGMKKDMGTCCLAVVEYNANDNNVQYRKAKADMYASNIQVLHKKPCLSIDIGGGNNVTNWITSVYALATRPDGFPPDTEIHLWDKPLLYQGTGISTIVRVAAGLLACLPYYSTQLDDFGERLGPCVGLVGSKVFKAFDPATRKANIDVIRCFLDKDAILWKSADELMEIVEMAHLESNWHGELTAGVFVSILEKLSALHKKGFVHGDIRLERS